MHEICFANYSGGVTVSLNTQAESACKVQKLTIALMTSSIVENTIPAINL